MDAALICVGVPLMFIGVILGIIGVFRLNAAWWFRVVVVAIAGLFTGCGLAMVLH